MPTSPTSWRALYAAAAATLLATPGHAQTTDWFAEEFTNPDARDLGGLQLTFTPDGSPDFYSVCSDQVTALPIPAASHQALTLTDDSSATVNLAGSPISLYGISTNTFYVGSNGYANFSSPDSSRDPLPANHFALPRVAGALADLDPSSGGRVSWAELADRVVVTFEGVPEFGVAANTNTFQIEFFTGGTDAVRITWLEQKVAGEVTAGLSAGAGVDPAYAESDLSFAYPPCPLPGGGTHLTEHFASPPGDGVDLANSTLRFLPDGSSRFYSAFRTPSVAGFPTDPTGGTAIPLLDDGSAMVTPTSAVSLFGTVHTDFFVNANGRVTFGSGSSLFSETLGAHFALPGISALFHDLDPSAGGAVSWRETADRVAVTFENVPDRGTGLPNSFQIEMFTDGSGVIAVTYLSVGTTAAIAGLSGGPGSTPAGFSETDLSTLPPPPEISVAGMAADENSGTVVFTVTLTEPLPTAVTVGYSTSAGTATGGADGDYTAVSGGAITIPAGQTSATATVAITDDATDELDETFMVTLSSPVNGGIAPGGSTATGTIIDDDPPPTLSIADAFALEGASATFTLSLDAPSGRDVEVTLSTQDGAALSGADFTALSGFQVTIPAGSTSGTVQVPVTDDNLLEPQESFTLQPDAGPHPTYSGSPSATAAIADKPTIKDSKRHAWEATAGWQNWRAVPHGGVVVGEYVLAGYAWSATTGWINLGDATPADGIRYSNTSAGDCGVNLAADGKLSGYAWSATTGWVTFEQAFGKPAIDRCTGRFSGYAWSPAAGWINLGTGTSNYLETSLVVIADADPGGPDGIDDAWERENFGGLAVANATTDRDRDGVLDIDEFISGTDPNDAGDYLLVNGIVLSGGMLDIVFPSNPNRKYSISASQDLVGWSDSGLGVFVPDAGASTTKRVTPPANTPGYFYRVDAHRPLSP